MQIIYAHAISYSLQLSIWLPGTEGIFTGQMEEAHWDLSSGNSFRGCGTVVVDAPITLAGSRGQESDYLSIGHEHGSGD